MAWRRRPVGSSDLASVAKHPSNVGARQAPTRLGHGVRSLAPSSSMAANSFPHGAGGAVIILIAIGLVGSMEIWAHAWRNWRPRSGSEELIELELLAFPWDPGAAPLVTYSAACASTLEIP